MVHVMSEVKRYVCHGCIWLPRDAYCPVCDPEKGWGKELDAQRLRADTAEAELSEMKLSCDYCNRVALHNKELGEELERKLATAEQRIADQHALLLKCKEVFDNCSGMADQKTRVDWYANYLVPTKVDLNAALNPNPEAESHE